MIKSLVGRLTKLPTHSVPVLGFGITGHFHVKLEKQKLGITAEIFSFILYLKQNV